MWDLTRKMAYASLIFFFCASCNLRFIKVNNPQQKTYVLKLLEMHNERVRQLKASVDIKGFGVLGGLAHERADMLVLTPHYFYWSLRSFFGPPAMVVASNGIFITMFDFSSGSKSYQSIPVEKNHSIEIFNIKILPSVMTALFLQRIPLSGAKEIEILEREDLIEIKAIVFGDWQLSAKFDRRTNTLTEQSLSNSSENVSYHIKYDEIRDYQGISFPSVMHLFTKNGTSRVRLELSLQGIELNGEPISKDVFYLRADSQRAP